MVLWKKNIAAIKVCFKFGMGAGYNSGIIYRAWLAVIYIHN